MLFHNDEGSQAEVGSQGEADLGEAVFVFKNKVFKTDTDKVKGTIGEENWDALTEAGFSIVWAQAINSWRGFQGTKYIAGSNSTLNQHGTDEAAIASGFFLLKQMYDPE